MIQTIKRAWKIPDLRKRIIYTLIMIVLFRAGSFIAVPYINTQAVEQLIGSNSMLGLLNIISGNNFSNFSIFAMSISPYITASIVINLLTVVIPSWERLSKEGEAGRKKLAKYTRYAALLLSVIQAYGVTVTVGSVLLVNTFWVKLLVITVVTAGSCLLLWMGESITEKGIGNGISIIIFVGIISSIPSAIQSLVLTMQTDSSKLYLLPIMIIFILLTVAGVVAVQEGTRKIPVQYAKRVVGRKVYGGRNTHLPLKVNQSGVIPIIFASTLTMFPSTLASFFPNVGWLASFAEFMSWGKTVPTIIYVVLTIAFTFFYTLVTFNPQDVANNLKQYGGFIPGIRPGAPTVQYLSKILNRLTLFGGLFLALIAIIPIIVGNVTGLNLQFGGTSLLIVVGVALETVKQLEQQMIMRNYKGFLK